MGSNNYPVFQSNSSTFHYPQIAPDNQNVQHSKTEFLMVNKAYFLHSQHTYTLGSKQSLTLKNSKTS